jgi:hypothetical protein
MHPLAHHTGEETLAPLLLLASGALSLATAYARARLAAARAKLARTRRGP